MAERIDLSWISDAALLRIADNYEEKLRTVSPDHIDLREAYRRAWLRVQREINLRHTQLSLADSFYEYRKID